MQLEVTIKPPTQCQRGVETLQALKKSQQTVEERYFQCIVTVAILIFGKHFKGPGLELPCPAGDLFDCCSETVPRPTSDLELGRV